MLIVLLVRVVTPAGARNMATLKVISMRLKSVTSIQKITKSMKMVSAAKYARAERALKDSRINGKGSEALMTNAKLTLDANDDKQLIIGILSGGGSAAEDVGDGMVMDLTLLNHSELVRMMLKMLKMM